MDLISKLVDHEGMSRFVYKDSLGFATIGCGRCIDPKSGSGLTVDEQIYLLKNDIARSRQELCSFQFYKIQNDVRKDALVELCFAMGLPRLLKFANMIAALIKQDYDAAAKELLDSLWAKEVHVRADDVAHRMRYGSYSVV